MLMLESDEEECRDGHPLPPEQEEHAVPSEEDEGDTREQGIERGGSPPDPPFRREREHVSRSVDRGSETDREQAAEEHRREGIQAEAQRADGEGPGPEPLRCGSARCGPDCRGQSRRAGNRSDGRAGGKPCDRDQCDVHQRFLEPDAIAGSSASRARRASSGARRSSRERTGVSCRAYESCESMRKWSGTVGLSSRKSAQTGRPSIAPKSTGCRRKQSSIVGGAATSSTIGLRGWGTAIPPPRPVDASISRARSSSRRSPRSIAAGTPGSFTTSARTSSLFVPATSRCMPPRSSAATRSAAGPAAARFTVISSGGKRTPCASAHSCSSTLLTWN